MIDRMTSSCEIPPFGCHSCSLDEANRLRERLGERREAPAGVTGAQALRRGFASSIRALKHGRKSVEHLFCAMLDGLRRESTVVSDIAVASASHHCYAD